MTTSIKGYRTGGKTHKSRSVAAPTRSKDRTPYKRNRPLEAAQQREQQQAFLSFVVNLFCLTIYTVLAFGLGVFLAENYDDPIMLLSGIAGGIILLFAMIIPGVRSTLADVKRIFAAE